jgi:hypothetical protein
MATTATPVKPEHCDQPWMDAADTPRPAPPPANCDELEYSEWQVRPARWCATAYTGRARATAGRKLACRGGRRRAAAARRRRSPAPLCLRGGWAAAPSARPYAAGALPAAAAGRAAFGPPAALTLAPQRRYPSVLDEWEQFEASTVGKRIAVFSDYDGAWRSARRGAAAACGLAHAPLPRFAAPQAR